MEVESANRIKNKMKNMKKINDYIYLNNDNNAIVAMTLQIVKYGTSGKAMVSGWTKLIQNIICGIQ